MCKLLNSSPIIIDAADLIAQPEQTLKSLCARVEITFDSAMLSWDKKKISDFDKWKGFVRHCRQKVRSLVLIKRMI